MAPERKVPIMRLNSSILDTEFDSIRDRFEAEMKKMEDEMNRFRTELVQREQNYLTRTSSSSMSSENTTTHKSEFRSSWSDGRDTTHVTSGFSRTAPATSPASSSSTATSGVASGGGGGGGVGGGNDYDSRSRKQNGTCTGNSSKKAPPSPPPSGSPPETHRSEVHAWLNGLHSPLIHDGDDGKELKLRFDVSQYAPEEIVVKTVDNKLQVHAKHEEKSENRSVYREYNREFLMPKGTNPELIKSSLSRDGILTIEAPLPALEGPKEHVIPIAQH